MNRVGITNLVCVEGKPPRYKTKEVIMASQKCPVCDWEIKDGGVKVTVGGKEITICCDDCAKEAIAKHEAAAAN